MERKNFLIFLFSFHSKLCLLLERLGPIIYWLCGSSSRSHVYNTPFLDAVLLIVRSFTPPSFPIDPVSGLFLSCLIPSLLMVSLISSFPFSFPLHGQSLISLFRWCDVLWSYAVFLFFLRSITCPLFSFILFLTSSLFTWSTHLFSLLHIDISNEIILHLPSLPRFTTVSRTVHIEHPQSLTRFIMLQIRLIFLISFL